MAALKQDKEQKWIKLDTNKTRQNTKQYKQEQQQINKQLDDGGFTLLLFSITYITTNINKRVYN